MFKSKAEFGLIKQMSVFCLVEKTTVSGTPVPSAYSDD